jgi:hypothetical protein
VSWWCLSGKVRVRGKKIDFRSLPTRINHVTLLSAVMFVI